MGTRPRISQSVSAASSASSRSSPTRRTTSSTGRPDCAARRGARIWAARAERRSRPVTSSTRAPSGAGQGRGRSSRTRSCPQARARRTGPRRTAASGPPRPWPDRTGTPSQVGRASVRRSGRKTVSAAYRSSQHRPGSRPCPRCRPRPPAGSASTTATRRPWAARARASRRSTVVAPIPPRAPVTATIRPSGGCWADSSSPSRRPAPPGPRQSSRSATTTGPGPEPAGVSAPAAPRRRTSTAGAAGAPAPSPAPPSAGSWRETTRIWRARAALSAAEAASSGPRPVVSRTSSTRPSRRGSSPWPGSMMTRGAVAAGTGTS